MDLLGTISRYPPPWHVRMCGEIIQSNTGIWICDARGAASAIVLLANEIQNLREVLQEHHEWHQQEGLEMKLGDEFFDVASNYCDSTLEERTTAALAVKA